MNHPPDHWRETVAVCAAIAVLSACAPRGVDSQSANEHIMQLVNQRLGSEMGIGWWVSNGRGGGAYTDQHLAKRELEFLVTRKVGNEEIVCGYAGFSPPKGYSGPMPSPDLFIVRDGRLFTVEDLTAEKFGRWQDQLCGPDWIKPISWPGVP